MICQQSCNFLERKSFAYALQQTILIICPLVVLKIKTLSRAAGIIIQRSLCFSKVGRKLDCRYTRRHQRILRVLLITDGSHTGLYVSYTGIIVRLACSSGMGVPGSGVWTSSDMLWI